MKFRLAKESEIKIVMEMCEEIKKTYPFWDEEYPILENFIESFEEIRPLTKSVFPAHGLSVP